MGMKDGATGQVVARAGNVGLEPDPSSGVLLGVHLHLPGDPMSPALGKRHFDAAGPTLHCTVTSHSKGCVFVGLWRSGERASMRLRSKVEIRMEERIAGGMPLALHTA
jgi:hypothetical protein